MPAWLSLPNILTLARLASVPFLVNFIHGGRYGHAAVLFFAAAVTDSVDGLLARRMHAITKFGSYLDPITDKTFLVAVFLALALRGDAPLWYVSIVFGRDLAIVAFAAVALLFTSYRQFTPTRWGKASTFFQIVTAIALVIRGAAPVPFVSGFAAAALVVSAAVTAWSAVHYAWRAWRS
jgi:cardiolipin synthase